VRTARRARRFGVAAITAALLAVAASATSSAHGGLPTAVEIERATDRFLDRHRAAPTLRTPSPRIARGPGGSLLPANRVVALYGAPQMGQTILGLRSPEGAVRKLTAQSLPYELGGRPIAGAFDLVSVFATAGGGPDGLYRTRQDDDIIQIYLDQARAVGARLILDIQPGRAAALDELRELREWIVQPDVDVALDPEWNVGPRGVPGRTEGKISAGKVNRIAQSMARIVREHGLPPKLLLVHQFRRGSVRGRTRIRQRDEVQVLLNFDGIGSPAAKQRGYADLSVPRLFDGFSLFYRRDQPLMTAASVLALLPEPDLLLYQ
jgi:hypothetical protein